MIIWEVPEYVIVICLCFSNVFLVCPMKHAAVLMQVTGEHKVIPLDDEVRNVSYIVPKPLIFSISQSGRNQILVHERCLAMAVVSWSSTETASS